MFDVCVIGHVTKDLICIDGKLQREMPGGTAYYTSIALSHLGLQVAVLTKVARADREELLCELRSCGVTVFCRDSDATTTFANCYRSEHFADRVQAVYATASPFSPDEVAPLDAALFHLGPLTNRDFSLDVLRAVARKGRLVSLDVQGFVRTVAHGAVKTTDWQDKAAGLPYIHILKAGEEEAKVLSGEVEAKRAALRLAAYGPAEVIVTLGSRGSVILSRGQFFDIPAL
ncbi:MAG: PfkB family carbohydrate kinase, partial [Candidatus Binatia bacterium]|nr:PfkB family carbohydrate kinase [Candidatus Binatia bacterium]